MKKILLLIITTILTANAQVPVSVQRSLIDGGGTFNLNFSADGTVSGSANPGTILTFSTAPFVDGGGNPSGILNSVSGSGQAVPTSFTQPGGHGGSNFSFPVTITGTPQIIIKNTAPAFFTNTITANVSYTPTGNTTVSQSFAFTVIEDGSGSTAASTNATLTSQADILTGLSRNSTDTSQRKLIGFQLKASSTATFKGLAFTLSNTSTNAVASNNFTSLQLLKDADGAQEFDGSDTVLATTTNANGFAIFSGLNILLTTTNQTFFLSGSFNPSSQSKNSFLTASLKGQNVTAVALGTTDPIEVTGGTAVGKQYAFLDNTTAEDEAFALSLTNGLGASSTTINNSSNSKKSLLSDTILPAAAAGAAGVGAAATSDQMNKPSQEFQPKQPQRSSEFSPRH